MNSSSEQLGTLISNPLDNNAEFLSAFVRQLVVSRSPPLEMPIDKSNLLAVN
jgi:hypothetical protein